MTTYQRLAVDVAQMGELADELADITGDADDFDLDAPTTKTWRRQMQDES